MYYKVCVNIGIFVKLNYNQGINFILLDIIFTL